MTKRILKLVLVWLTAITVVPLYGQSSGSRQAQSQSEKNTIDGKAAYIEGLQEFENANYERALDLLSTAYVKLPGHSGVNFALADAYLKIGDLANASFYGKKAVELEPENKWLRLKLAEIYRRAGKNEATIEELEKTLEYHPNATDVLAELAETHASHGNLEKSNRTYNKLLKLTGDNISIHLQKLKNFNEMGMQDSAIAELEAIRRLDPDNLSTMQTLSNYYLEMNKLDQAKSILKKALEKNERDPKTLIMLADVYAEEAMWDSVGSLLENVVADPLVSPDAKLTVSQYLVSQFREQPENSQLKQATSSLINTFTTSEPGFGQAHALAADYYMKTEQNELALQSLSKTNELIPSNDAAWRQRMQLLLAQGSLEEAIKVGAEADKHVPQDPFIMFFWGSAYLGSGQHKPAAEKLETASTLPARKELKSAIFNSLGDANAALKNWDKAFSVYDRALKINPDNDLVLNNYAYYLSLQSKNLDKAEQMALRANEISPGNASYLDTVGWVYYQKGNYEKALEYIKTSIATGQASATVMEHMGDILDKLNKPEQAKEWWEKAYQKDNSKTHLKDKISK